MLSRRSSIGSSCGFPEESVARTCRMVNGGSVRQTSRARLVDANYCPSEGLVTSGVDERGESADPDRVNPWGTNFPLSRFPAYGNILKRGH